MGCSPIADVPCLPELIRLKYLTEVNRWTALDDVALLGAYPDPARSLLWRELLHAHGVRDIASMVFKDRFGCWGFLDLYRYHQDFTRAEASYLAHLTAPVTTALRRSQAETFVVRPSDAPRPGPLVLLLSPDLRVLGQTLETHAYLSLLVPPEHGRPPVPASAYNVAAQLLAVEARVDANPPRSRVHLADGLWLTLRAARIGDAAPLDRRDIAVTIEETSPTERLAVFTRAFALSPREGDLLGHLAKGGDSHTVARQMFLSEHTVQDHLKSIFAKTSTHNRRTLLTRALGA
ncbi:helix-turn-helix transcriptional regulator [Streptomyces sp. H10-C2]|uniref:helix-turn-helix transcriptional regulator n=1 Tax=unclassified Streptomyces TaxID=2593676 RepID=UPI0024B88953|nr:MULTISPECIES: helix-turn-helix transcriptional regulator [unclassified Streptomyces]MDJ0345360.1 helix-turn-helix transcriptional regulator [Streptomyces sp. PH10-H1]MDJ0372115.1 helix-turn-helix transcriptional regulator [Streptomyces sp. H10-C2]